MDLDLLPLRAPTPPTWLPVVLADFDEFLIDHASCERKAAASALSFIARHSEHPAIVEPMTALAREELEHFGQVYRLLQRRGLRLGPDQKDPYVNLLLEGVRTGREERLLDRLLIASLIEARSCERFHVLLGGLTDPGLKDFYETLYRSEAGHYRVFIRVAERLFPEKEVKTQLDRLCDHEVKAMLQAPLRPAVH